MNLKNTLILDCEVYSNYFLVSIMSSDGLKVVNYEMYEGMPLNKKALLTVLNKRTTIGFNSLSYDLPILASALAGFTNQEIKDLSDDIIISQIPSYQILRKHCLDIPNSWDHIDIIELPIGQSSLKIYGGRLHAPKLQDLPIEPSAKIKPDERELLKRYCKNDLDTTNLLFKKLLPQIELREEMSEQYGCDLRSKSDAQIAETVLKSELEKIKGGKIKRPTIPAGTKFKYNLPPFIKFTSEVLKDTLKIVLNADFEVLENGSIKLPDELSNKKITINTSIYRMGIGGLHSTEEGRTTIAEDEYVICDKDCASFYPNIILGQGLYPRQFGKDFLTVYKSIVDRRIEAKKAGDKVTADALKITINGSYGKLGSKYSTLYAPDLMIQTTLSGQLALLMLIERFEENGIEIVSANTDGIVTYYHESKTDLVESIAYEWELDSGYELEDTFYKSLHCRDVNNYIAIKLNGDTKGKGVFGDSGLSKNPSNAICVTAVKNYLTADRAIEDTIYKCSDIREFVTVRSVKGGAVWNNESIGKSIRWYYADGLSEPILYKSNGNKVPRSDGAFPLMDLPDNLPTDINYQWYIDEAYSLLKGFQNERIDNRKSSGKVSKRAGLFDV